MVKFKRMSFNANSIGPGFVLELQRGLRIGINKTWPSSGGLLRATAGSNLHNEGCLDALSANLKGYAFISQVIL
jgi:hypothetical protein